MHDEPKIIGEIENTRNAKENPTMSPTRPDADVDVDVDDTQDQTIK